MRSRRSCYAFAVCIFLSLHAFAAEDAKVMPANIRRVTVRYVSTDISEKTDGGFNAVPLSKPLNKALTFNDILKGEKDPVKNALTSGFLAAEGFNTGNAVGQFAADVKTRVQVTAPIFTFGLTPLTTIAVAIPIYRMQTAAEVSFQANEMGQQFVNDAFEPKDRPIAAGLFGMGIVLGPTLGPTLGGYIIDHSSWPLIFMINIPVGIAATLLTFYFVEKKPNEGKSKDKIKIDYTGILLLMAGIGCLQYVLERGQAEDWLNSESIRICSVIAVLGLISFIFYELSIPQPAVNIRLLGNRNLAFTTIFTFVAGFGLFTSVFIYPVLAQRVLGFTAYETGNSLLLPTLAAVILMPIIGKMMSKGVTPIPLIIIGYILFSVYAFMSASVSPDVGKSDFFFPLLVRAVGIALCQLPLINQAVVGLEPKDYPTGISLNNMIRQLGGAFGIAVANNFVATRYAQHRSDLVSAMPAGSFQLNERVNAISQGIIAKTGDVAGATNKAYTTISYAVDKQAYYLSYLDSFRLIGIFFLLVLPMVAFLRVKKKTAAEAAVAMKATSEAH